MNTEPVEEITHQGEFTFFGLDPNSEYEVIIQSRNREGWSDPSEIFKFRTRNEGKISISNVIFFNNLMLK